VASFEVSHDLPPVGEAVMFDASEAYDSNGEIIRYAWEFGDGNTGSGVETSHTYMEDGDYVATLTVADNEGATGQAHHAISVQENSGGCPGGSCGDSGDRPLAVITGLPSCQGGRVGVPIELDGSASRAAEGTIIRHAWDFGDDESAVGERVSHTYQRTGRFIVTLTVTDDEGRRTSVWGSVSIGTSCY